SAHADETLDEQGVPYHFVSDTTPRRSRVGQRVASLLPDVVHVQGLHHGRAVRWLTRALRGRPVLVEDHGNMEPQGWWRMALKLAFQSIDGVAFTVKDQAAPWMARGVLLASLPVFDVLEGSSRFSPGDQREARRSTGLFGDPCVLW